MSNRRVRYEVSATTEGTVKSRAYDTKDDKLIITITMSKEEAQAFAAELLDAVRMLGGVA